MAENGVVSMNFGKTNIFNGSSLTYNIGTIYPQLTAAANAFYNASVDDNVSFYMWHPQNRQVIISIKMCCFNKYDNYETLYFISNDGRY